MLRHRLILLLTYLLTGSGKTKYLSFSQLTFQNTGLFAQCACELFETQCGLIETITLSQVYGIHHTIAVVNVGEVHSVDRHRLTEIDSPP